MPGVQKTPLGVYDHDVDPDVPGLRSLRIGRSGVARFAKTVTGLADELVDLIDRLDGPL